MTPDEIEAERLTRDFLAMSPEWRVWTLIIGAGLKCGALTDAEVTASAEASDDPIERSLYLMMHCTIEQRDMICTEFAKVPMVMPGEGHA